jgi:hypothetical protein
MDSKGNDRLPFLFVFAVAGSVLDKIASLIRF